MTIRLRLAAAALLAGLGLLVAGAAATPAGAHEGKAVITIEQVHPAGTSVHYIVRVTWENDGHPAVDATVTATGVVASGEQLTPVTLDQVDDDGRYAGAVEYPGPGTYTVRITSIDPTGTAEQSETVTASPSTQPSDVSAPSEVTTGTAPEAGDSGFAPEDDGTGASDEGGADEQAAAGGDGDDGMPIWLIAAAAVVAIGGAVTGVGVIRRYRGPGGPGGPGGSGGADGGDGGDGVDGGDGGEGDPRVEAGSAGTDRP
jgi:hypothetical protein